MLNFKNCECACHRYKEQCHDCCQTVLLQKVCLQRQVDEIVERLNDIENWRKGIKILADQSQKPHECPVCNGMKKFKVFGQDKTADCPPCEGKGIVWK